MRQPVRSGTVNRQGTVARTSNIAPPLRPSGTSLQIQHQVQGKFLRQLLACDKAVWATSANTVLPQCGRISFLKSIQGKELESLSDRYTVNPALTATRGPLSPMLKKEDFTQNQVLKS
jgi:hypothetical protein